MGSKDNVQQLPCRTTLHPTLRGSLATQATVLGLFTHDRADKVDLDLYKCTTQLHDTLACSDSMRCSQLHGSETLTPCGRTVRFQCLGSRTASGGIGSIHLHPTPN